GQGGMATVYLAHDIRHDRKVAVKVLRPELAAVIGAERFLQEIRVTAHLQHPHLLPLFDSGEADTFLFYVMPYVEGESLRARLVREKQLPLEEAGKITEAAARALDYAHRHKVIHRDIKPENILLHEGQPLIADFGIALAVSVAGGNRLTETGLSLGTPQYMSPEQATGDRQLDARSDIYALGCVLYEMLAGEPPYTGPTTQAIIAKVLTEQPRPLRALRSTVPLLVEAAVQKALQKLPADRFATAADFAEALTKPTAGVPSWRAPLPLTQEAAAAAPLGAFRRWLAVGVGLILLLGGFALGRWLRPLPGGYAPVARLQALFAGGRAVVSIYRLGGDVALSPDGSRLAISADGDQGPGIYLRALDDLEARLLPGTQGGLSPFFSPDGRWVGFWKLGEGRLKKISVAGGPAVPIATAFPSLGCWRNAPADHATRQRRDPRLARDPSRGEGSRVHPAVSKVRRPRCPHRRRLVIHRESDRARSLWHQSAFRAPRFSRLHVRGRFGAGGPLRSSQTADYRSNGTRR
ncbi:MAG: protein kinase, partial [Gemmatimonadetes bacterium]|nr:protein kinase [Gemmatimonadota bacterium]